MTTGVIRISTNPSSPSIGPPCTGRRLSSAREPSRRVPRSIGVELARSSHLNRPRRAGMQSRPLRSSGRRHPSPASSGRSIGATGSLPPVRSCGLRATECEPGAGGPGPLDHHRNGPQHCCRRSASPPTMGSGTMPNRAHHDGRVGGPSLDRVQNPIVADPGGAHAFEPREQRLAELGFHCDAIDRQFHRISDCVR